MTEVNDQLIIVKTLKAPKQLVFDAFTQSHHLAHWWGPAGFDLEVMHLDVKPGGRFHYKMTSLEGFSMYGVFEYLEMDSPNKISFTSSFADEKGNVIRAPFDSRFPLKVHNTWTFIEDNGITTLTLTGHALAETTEEKDFYHGMFGSMNEGFGKTFVQLDTYLKVCLAHKKNFPQSTPRVSGYVNFNGNTEEALLFYKQVFKTDFIAPGIRRLGEAPPHEGMPPLDDHLKNMVLHAELPLIGGFVLMATDAPEAMGFTLKAGNNMHFNLEPDSFAEAKRLFEELSAGGVVEMPFQKMFWGAWYAGFQDKYGIHWMINCVSEA